MSVQLDVQLADDLADSIEEPPPSRLLCDWAQAAWQGDFAEQPVLSLRIVGEAESQQLNHDYRGKNTPTNVLSFPLQFEAAFADVSMPEIMLGDLAICAAVVVREAGQQQKTPEAHWAHMVVHGMLHLQGFDHIEEDEALQMESLETQIMLTLGFADPYLLNSSGEK
jgi:probable rRNA maturation factor